MTLRQQLREITDKQRERNTTQLCEALRKMAFDRAASGYSDLVYNVDIPINWKAVNDYFANQDIKVDNSAYVLRLTW